MKTEEYEIISRAEAKAQGLKYYFTGKPCKNGGIGQRRTSDGLCRCEKCREVKAKNGLLRYKDNREAILERSRQYYEENRETVSERHRRYRDENLESVVEYQRRWREENIEAIRERRRQYREDNREACLERQRRYREEKREAIAEYSRVRYENNREAILERSRQYYEENRDSAAERHRQYRSDNPEKMLAAYAKRRAAKRQAIPSWFGEFDQFAFEEAYELAAQREADTGFEWHVDHIVPLQAKKACGLHCAANIQVIPAKMNLSKGNKMVLTEPLEWLRVWKKAHNVSMRPKTASKEESCALRAP